MENVKEGGAWKTVPVFGDWDMKSGVPDYSMDFTKIREMRKQNKNRASIGNDAELVVPDQDQDHQNGRRDPGRDTEGGSHRPSQHAPTARKKIKSYFNCCMIGA